MPASLVLTAKGAKLQRKNPSTSVYEDIPQLRLVPNPRATQEYADGTNHDSPGGFEENAATIKRGDDLSFNLVYHYDIALHVQLWTDFIDQTKLTWRSLFPGGVHGWDFEARVSSFDLPLEHAGIVILTGSLKVTGLPTIF